MCIRDRPRVARNNRPARGGAHPERSDVPGFPSPSSRGQTCLLYTSDAADERSSVDLGGRRIIKKKKY